MAARHHGNTTESLSGTLILPTPSLGRDAGKDAEHYVVDITKNCRDEGSQGRHGVPGSTGLRHTLPYTSFDANFRDSKWLGPLIGNLKTQVDILAPSLRSWDQVTSGPLTVTQRAPLRLTGVSLLSRDPRPSCFLTRLRVGELGFSLGLATNCLDDLENVTEPSWVSVSTSF